MGGLRLEKQGFSSALLSVPHPSTNSCVLRGASVHSRTLLEVTSARLGLMPFLKRIAVFFSYTWILKLASQYSSVGVDHRREEGQVDSRKVQRNASIRRCIIYSFNYESVGNMSESLYCICICSFCLHFIYWDNACWLITNLRHTHLSDYTRRREAKQSSGSTSTRSYYYHLAHYWGAQQGMIACAQRHIASTSRHASVATTHAPQKFSFFLSSLFDLFCVYFNTFFRRSFTSDEAPVLFAKRL